MCFNEEDKRNTIERYAQRFQTFGNDPKTLGWDKGKQDIRFEVLTSQYDFENKSILDIGCGFGDLNKVLVRRTKNYSYVGIDLVDVLIKEAGENYHGDNIIFENSNILEYCPGRSFDYAISSGIFNHKLTGKNNYDFIEAVIEKSLSLVKDGIAFDFLSDKVDYEYEHTFHSSPERILTIAYKYSRNIILRNDYMPFEFSLFIFKDDSFNKNETIFNNFRSKI